MRAAIIFHVFRGELNFEFMKILTDALCGYSRTEFSGPEGLKNRCLRDCLTQLQGRKERRRVEPESDIICGRDSLFWSEENNSTLEGNAGQSRPTWGKLEHAGRTPAAEQGGSQWRGRIVGVASGVANQIVGVVNKKEKLNQWKQQAANFLANCVQDKNTGTKMFLHTS